MHQACFRAIDVSRTWFSILFVLLWLLLFFFWGGGGGGTSYFHASLAIYVLFLLFTFVEGDLSTL